MGEIIHLSVGQLKVCLIRRIKMSKTLVKECDVLINNVAYSA